MILHDNTILQVIKKNEDGTFAKDAFSKIQKLLATYTDKAYASIKRGKWKGKMDKGKVCGKMFQDLSPVLYGNVRSLNKVQITLNKAVTKYLVDIVWLRARTRLRKEAVIETSPGKYGNGLRFPRTVKSPRGVPQMVTITKATKEDIYSMYSKDVREDMSRDNSRIKKWNAISKSKDITDFSEVADIIKPTTESDTPTKRGTVNKSKTRKTKTVVKFWESIDPRYYDDPKTPKPPKKPKGPKGPFSPTINKKKDPKKPKGPRGPKRRYTKK